MADRERLVRSRRVVLPDGVRAASILIRDGTIAAITPYQKSAGENFGGLIIMPGLVDTHVHINEPGRGEWEGFATATAAAAAGGITTLIDMPLNSIPTTVSATALEAKISAAQGQCRVDCGFWGGVVPGNEAELRPLWQAGCFGFKCFLAPSGVDEFPHVTEADLRLAMPQIAACGGVLLAHAEDPARLVSRGQTQNPSVSESAGMVVRPPSRPPQNHSSHPAPNQYASYLASRPPCAEASAIELLVRLSRETGCRLHVLHLSSSESLPGLKAARTAGVRVTTETCPHYLALTADEIPDGATEFKCAPPIRDRSNRDALWRGLASGEIDFVVSDHSPCPPALKCRESGDFFVAWGGIAALELGLAAVWTEARRRDIGVENIVRWMSAGPARLAGLDRRKGAIAPGYDADLVVWDPDASFVVDPARLLQRHRLTPYAGRRLFGAVHKTLLAGRDVDADGPPRGRVWRRWDPGLGRTRV